LHFTSAVSERNEGFQQ